MLEAIVITGVGLAISRSDNLAGARYIGGIVVAAGIAVMHFTGMMAFEVQGHIKWDSQLVVVSILLAGLLGAFALPVALKSNHFGRKLSGAFILMLAICSHHFTAMGAAEIIPDPTVLVSNLAVPTIWLGIAVAVTSIAILGLTVLALVLDLREQRRANESLRIRQLADAAVEGLIVCDDSRIVSANLSFCELANTREEDAVIRPVQSFFEDFDKVELAASDNSPVETLLKVSDEETVPVELINREIFFCGRPHRLLAIRDIRERKDAEKEIHFLAHNDPLTKLPNRNRFNEELDQLFAGQATSRNCFAVMLIDLDHFKQINDVYGHMVGDQVLKVSAESIKKALRPGDFIGRLGGDEFAVIVPNLTSPDDAEKIADRIKQSLVEGSLELPRGVSIGASIGIAACPDHAKTADTLLRHADASLYDAKANGRGIHRTFDSEMFERLKTNREIQIELIEAIKNDDLHLVYQPIVDTQSGETLGFETLARWDHSELGEIPPSIFIPIAEESGLISQIGEWVLKKACKEAAGWKKPLSVAVNVSPKQLHGSDLPAVVRGILKKTGLEPSRLDLEITETALIADPEKAKRVLDKLKAIGVRLSMDDFGTGYSSLSNLRIFPFDQIKIDQSFVHGADSNEESASIVRAVIGLAHELKLSVLAEGVETCNEMNFLREQSCDLAQGYLLGRPLPISEYEHCILADVESNVIKFDIDLRSSRAS